MTQTEKRVIIGFADNDMNLSKTARVLHYHPNSLRYHFPRITEKYNLNPLKFYDLIKLVEMARGE